MNTFVLNTEADKQRLLAYIKGLDIQSNPFIVKVAKNARKRTADQNRLYWLWLNCVSDETGNSVDDLHLFFKQKFLGTYARCIFGEEVVNIPTTKTLNTKQFTDYLDRVQMWCLDELSIQLPNPDDLRWASFEEKYKNFI